MSTVFLVNLLVKATQCVLQLCQEEEEEALKQAGTFE